MTGFPEGGSTVVADGTIGAVDSHHHFWRRGEAHQSWRGPEHDVLDRSFQPDDLAPSLQAMGIAQTVLVQSVNTEEENGRLLEYAAQVPTVAGVVAWLPLADERTAEPMLQALLEEPAVRGVRCLIGSDDIDWLLQPAALRLLTGIADAGLAWDVVPVTAGQVRTVLQVAERLPQLKLVIDHLGRPPVDAGGWEPWAGQLKELSGSPAVAVKASVGIDVLTSWQHWAPSELQRYLSWVVEQFGVDRMMLASNWPVIELRASHTRAWQDLEAGLRAAGAEPAALERVRGGTARAWYGLEASVPAR